MLSRTSRPVTAALTRLVRTGVTQSTPSPAQTGTPVPSPTPSQNLPPVEAPPPQAPNRVEPWSIMQAPRPAAASLPRFEQTDMSLQPRPLSAMQLVSEDPIRIVHGRKAVCDGGECRVTFFGCIFTKNERAQILSFLGGGPLGHPKIFINLVCSCPR